MDTVETIVGVAGWSTVAAFGMWAHLAQRRTRKTQAHARQMRRLRSAVYGAVDESWDSIMRAGIAERQVRR